MASDFTDAGPIFNSEFSLKEGVAMRDFISTANDAVEIVTFDRALPSMNDIFIKTVEGYNAAHNISTTPDE